MKFTKDEIALCKKIAEKHRKEIKYGDWVYHEPYKNYFLVVESMGFIYKLQMGKRFDAQNNKDKKVNTPLWQISDCLEFLYEGYEEVGVESLRGKWEASVYLHRKIRATDVIDTDGKTPLEALLKAVLAILGEK